ncbi:Uncharacterised protein [Escherichia coli]|nr:Uncharacterised protein [Escherichia coli]
MLTSKEAKNNANNHSLQACHPVRGRLLVAQCSYTNLVHIEVPFSGGIQGGQYIVYLCILEVMRILPEVHVQIHLRLPGICWWDAIITRECQQ